MIFVSSPRRVLIEFSKIVENLIKVFDTISAEYRKKSDSSFSGLDALAFWSR
jgi:hypothetical protein